MFLSIDLTQQIQNPNSTLFRQTNLTKDIDSLWGLQVVTWDISLKLTYAIEVIGGDLVKNGYYLNGGGLGVCDYVNSAAFETYCEFERFFEDDVSRALQISYYRVQIMFIKKAALDAVLVHFRIMPPQAAFHVSSMNGFYNLTSEVTVEIAITNLIAQVNDDNSELYKGNVTIRVDPLWGVSATHGRKRSAAARFTLKYYEYDVTRLNNTVRKSLITSYDRCKANRRCNWGIQEINQYTNDVRYFHRLFDRGNLYEVPLFLDFEDWRLGSRGFSWIGSIPPAARGNSTIVNKGAINKHGFIRGAHFNPFFQSSLGPDVPCYLTERNQGLILDRQLQQHQIEWQEALVSDLSGRVNWMQENIEWATMGPVLRSRKDTTSKMTWERSVFNDWLNAETDELIQLNSSQCAKKKCSIRFDTSTLLLTGAITGKGVVLKTPNGTEVAVFTFNSIYLGPETEVLLVGQRALSLISKTAAIINTTFISIPGTIGGFPGGYSVARFVNDSLSDRPRDVLICEIGNYCKTDDFIPVYGSWVRSGNKTTSMTNAERARLISNNVNGPGSGNLRIHPFVITSFANDIKEIQSIRTSAQAGQTLAGGFKLHFGEYSTPIIPHDVTADLLRAIIETNLNIFTPSDGLVQPTRTDRLRHRAGVGKINITRSYQDNQEGYIWNITFATYIGNVPTLKVTSYLQALAADVQISTIRDGNELSGDFTLTFQGKTTTKIGVYETAQGLKEKLLKLPNIRTAFVERNDPTENCDDGLCPNGPNAARGMVWTVYVTTDRYNDNISPLSPTSPLIALEGVPFRFTAETSNLKAIGANINITWGTLLSTNTMAKLLNTPRSFSLAYGGAGASYGGRGGAGYSDNPVGDVYSDEKLTDLLGGSGGCMRTPHPFEINAMKNSVTGRGGHGGGAIEIVAANDIIIGTHGKIIVDGGDGEQSSEGGAGGGSGGSILLAAGGVVVHLGVLSAGGGDGGYGGSGKLTDYTAEELAKIKPGSREFKDLYNLAGGGGGGGRVALFAQSIVNQGVVNLAGGVCGVIKRPVTQTVFNLNATVSMQFLVPLDMDRLAFLGATFINSTILDVAPVMFVNYISSSAVSVSTYTDSGLTYTLSRTSLTFQIIVASSGNISAIQNAFGSLNSSKLGEVDMTGVKLFVTADTFGNPVASLTISPPLSFPSNCSNDGENGTFYTEATITSNMAVMHTAAAEGTSKALFLSNREATRTMTGSAREAPFAWNGPTIPFRTSKPTRITYYSRLDAVKGESKKSNFGTLFSLLSRGDSGNAAGVIGVFIGDKIMHGANFGTAVDEKAFLKRMVTLDEYPSFDRWYKIDIHIQWNSKTYFIMIDDTLVTDDVSFTADNLDSIRLSVNRATDVWFDEIYVGFDNTMSFKCPKTSRGAVSTMTPIQRSWSMEELSGDKNNFDGATEYTTMQRHYSHLADPVGKNALDGQGQISVYQDIKIKYPSGDIPDVAGKLHAGALMYLKNSLRSGKIPSGRSATVVNPNGLWFAAKSGKGGAGDGTQYWYTEHAYDTSAEGATNISYLGGGVVACSSQDLMRWRFEGIVVHNTNLSDLVFGNIGSFSVARPKVLFNQLTQTYVMWAVIDTPERKLAMNAIFTSPYEDGPFLFRRSFYPDGNTTRDQVIYERAGGVLARTYYATVEFVMPEKLMQPTWESVKNKDGSRNFSQSYHRASYAIGYDDFHDIYEQRWRKEDKLWNVTCVDKLTGARRNLPPPVEGADPYNISCTDPNELKIIFGQGRPPVILRTRFIDPDNEANSWWRQTSVPSVHAQKWKQSYRDGYCGIRRMNSDHTIDDPELAGFLPADNNNCSNIADNPIHASLQDKLIGVQKVVTSRRTKFAALSELTPDYMDTTGGLNVYEGELSSGTLLTLITEMGQFGFGAGSDIASTAPIPVRSEFETADDYQIRFRQYISNPNDRSKYALGCAIDQVCPVNYRDQLTQGHI